MARPYQFSYERKCAPLGSEFGLSYAAKVFKMTPEAIEEKVGRYTKGKNKGQIRGWLVWFKTTRGGWVKTGRYDFDSMHGCGFVTKKDLTFGHHVEINGAAVLGSNPESNGMDGIAQALRDANDGGRRSDEMARTYWASQMDAHTRTCADAWKIQTHILNTVYGEIMKGLLLAQDDPSGAFMELAGRLYGSSREVAS